MSGTTTWDGERFWLRFSWPEIAARGGVAVVGTAATTYFLHGYNTRSWEITAAALAFYLWALRAGIRLDPYGVKARPGGEAAWWEIRSIAEDPRGRLRMELYSGRSIRLVAIERHRRRNRQRYDAELAFLRDAWQRSLAAETS